MYIIHILMHLHIYILYVWVCFMAQIQNNDNNVGLSFIDSK